MWIYSTFLSYFNLTATHTFRRQRKYVKVTNMRFFLPPFCLGSYSTVSRCAQSLIFPNAKERPLGNSWFSRFTFITRPTRWWIYILRNCFPILLFNDFWRWSRKSPAVVIDVKRLRTINGFVHPFAFRKNRLSITLYRSTGSVWQQPSLKREPSDFNEKFLYWYLDWKRRDGAIKTHRGHFYFVSGKRQKIRMPSSLRYGKARAERKIEFHYCVKLHSGKVVLL